jgi:hypothetical protein
MLFIIYRAQYLRTPRFPILLSTGLKSRAKVIDYKRTRATDAVIQQQNVSKWMSFWNSLWATVYRQPHNQQYCAFPFVGTFAHPLMKYFHQHRTTLDRALLKDRRSVSCVLNLYEALRKIKCYRWKSSALKFLRIDLEIKKQMRQK